jgi:thymidylate synthase
MFLGFPFNIFSYATLTYLLAKRHNMLPKDLIVSGGDTHIYLNHLDQVKEQLNKKIRPSPKLIISDAVVEKKIEDISITDFEVVGYYPHDVIKAPMN